MDVSTDKAYSILTNLNISINKRHELKYHIDFTTDTISKVLLCEDPNKAVPIGAVKQNWFNKFFKRHVSKSFDLVKCSDKIKELYNSAKNMPNLIQEASNKKFCRANLINISFNINMILTTAVSKYQAQLDNPGIFSSKKSQEKLQKKITALSANIEEIRQATPKLAPTEIELALSAFDDCNLNPDFNKALINNDIDARNYKEAIRKKEMLKNNVLKARELFKLVRSSTTADCSFELFGKIAKAHETLQKATNALEDINANIKKNPPSTSERLQNFANSFFKNH